MDHLPQIEKVIESLSKLPSVGKKSAERIAYSLLDMDENDVSTLLNDIQELKSSISYCPICGAYKENENCEYCNDETRNREIILVVSHPKDVFSFEKSEEYHGLFHVLNGVIQPSKGIGPDQLNIETLISRIKNDNIKEEDYQNLLRSVLGESLCFQLIQLNQFLILNLRSQLDLFLFPKDFFSYYI